MLAGLRPAAPWSAVLARGPRPPEPPQAVAPVGGSTSALLSRPRRAAHTSRAINAIPFSVVAGVGYDWRMSNGQRQAALELTIGVVGSHDLVERIMLSGAATSGPGAPGAAMPGTVPGAAAPGPASGPAGAAAAPGGNGGDAAAPAVARRLVAVAYRTEQEAGDKVLRLGTGIDVWLFASRVPYAYARQAGVLGKPRSEEHTSELQSHVNLVCRLLLEKKKTTTHPGGQAQRQPPKPTY